LAALNHPLLNKYFSAFLFCALDKEAKLKKELSNFQKFKRKRKK